MEVSIWFVAVTPITVALIVGGVSLWRRRNGHNSQNHRNREADRLIDLIQARDEVFLSMARTQESGGEVLRRVADNQGGILDSVVKVQDIIGRLFERHIEIDGQADKWQALQDAKLDRIERALERIEGRGSL